MSGTPAKAPCPQVGGEGVLTLRRSFLAALALAVVVLGCASPMGQRGAGTGSDAGTASRASGRKRVAMAIRGNPTTLNAAINSAGPGGVAGVSELEIMVHAG